LSGETLDKKIVGLDTDEMAAEPEQGEEEQFLVDPNERDGAGANTAPRPSPADVRLALILDVLSKQNAHVANEDVLAEITKILGPPHASKHRADPNKATRRIMPEDLTWKEGFLEKYFEQMLG